MSDFQDKLFASQEPKEIDIEFEGATWKFKIKELTWAQKNKILSGAISVGKDGSPSFDVDKYMREMLCAILVDAPWGQTTHTILAQIKPGLGAKLEALIPKEGTQGEFFDFFGRG